MTRKSQVILLIILAIVVPCTLPSAAAPQPGLSSEDYSFMWWAHGWRGRSPSDERILCMQTGRYGLAIDVERVALLNLGPIVNAAAYDDAVRESNDVVFHLPEPTLSLVLTTAGHRFRCVRGATHTQDNLDFPIRIIESGRFVQRMDILQLELEDDNGTRLEAEARLEIVAWPDRLSFLSEVVPTARLPEAELRIILNDGENERGSTVDYPYLEAGQEYTVALTWTPDATRFAEPTEDEVSVVDITAGDIPVPVRYDAKRGWCHIGLPNKTWSIADEPNHLDRFGVTLSNPSGRPRVYRLLFAIDEGVSHITGMSPMLRDRDGTPSGIPVQISKNWHRQAERPLLYEGPWFHGFTMIRVPPHDTWSGEFTIAYALWGGVPAASHAQLSLIGWGVNQLWDQVAIGSWGESICYDPDVNLNRSMIDDVRPLMVWGMGEEAKRKWRWTNNVGGGDFLVYFDGNDQKQFLSRMRTAYQRYGPNLTEVTYAGVTSDGNISARITVSTPRCDDINRAYHRFRYEVLKPTPFKRLAFYQLGSDGYNDHQFRVMARGNADAGMVDVWKPKQGGKRYERCGLLCDGAMPWFSLHEAISRARGKGAWANRGLVIRSWRARLGGKDAPVPYASVYGTENGPPSANVELAPQPALTRLEPGDFVDAEVELIVMPMSADDYYGPNENLRSHLEKHANTWRPIHRQALGNRIEVNVQRGRLVRRYPIVVEVDPAGRAEFELTGGLGYVPIRLDGLRDHRGHSLFIERRGRGELLDQTVTGNDYWQTDFDPVTGCFSITYNVFLDTPDDKPETARFVFE